MIKLRANRLIFTLSYRRVESWVHHLHFSFSVMLRMASVVDDCNVPLTSSSGKQFQIVNNRRQNVSEEDMSGKKRLYIPNDITSLKAEGKRLVEIFFAEFIGTGLLLLFGCMSQIIWNKSDMPHPWQGSVVFAVVVATIVQIFGHISAAHINPAVTLCFFILGHVTALQGIVYMVAQILGGLAGFGMLKLITPCDIYELSMDYSDQKLCVNYPHADLSDFQAIIAEFLATTLLVLVVCSCSDPRNATKGDSVPLKFGATILALCLAEGPYTGASMNPARSLAPVVWTGSWDKHWIYWIGTFSGSFFATIFYMKLFGLKASPQSESIQEIERKSNQLHDVKTRK